MQMSENTNSWIKEYLEPRYPDLVAPYRAAERIRDAALDSGVLPEGNLAIVLESAMSSRTPLGENVAAMLGELADRFDAARSSIRRMAQDSKVHVRINALVALHSHALSQLHQEVLAQALRDRSGKVRGLAADKIMSLGLRPLLPALEEAIARETKQDLRGVLERERDLLRDGFRTEGKDDGTVWVTCRGSGGTTSRSFPLGEMETTGRKWIKEMLSQAAANLGPNWPDPTLG
jgi:hypothetical protein